METLIRCHILRHLIWVCTVCQLPFYGSPDYNGLKTADEFKSDILDNSLVVYHAHSCEYPQHMFSWTEKKKKNLIPIGLRLLGQAMPWPVVRHPSVVSPLLAFHIFDISSRSISWIELKLSGWHCGNMEIQNC